MPSDRPEHPDGQQDSVHHRERPGNSVSVFPYPGGKGREHEWIVSRMPQHDTYVEVFGGSGAILYNKPESTNEVFNDINEDIVQFFRVLRERPEDLQEWVRRVPYSRAVYEKWSTAYFEGERPSDPVERAGRFYTLRFMQFAGDISAKNGFKTRAKRSPARTFDNARARLESVAERFRQVVVEDSDYRDTFRRYDDPDVDVLFYCDPPYVGTEHYYGREFDHEEFIEALRGLESDWMVSYAGLPDGLRDIGYTLARDRRHRMCRNVSGAREHLVCSFDPSEVGGFVDADHTQQRLGGVVR